MVFNNAYQGKKILITGITGFKGAWLARWLQIMGSKVQGIGLDPETDPSLCKLLNLPYEVLDIRNHSRLRHFIHEFQPDLVIHLAAQSLVRRSYELPLETYETNLMGSLNLYKSCMGLKSIKGIISITSDKVYENKERLAPYKESDQLGGYDMYSSSKACVEIMTSSFSRSFSKEIDFPILTVRAGNVIGGGDWAKDRIIPDMYYAVKNNKKIQVRNPEAVRPWQHVLEPLSGYLLLGEHLINKRQNKMNDTWNFGPENEKLFTVKELLELAHQYWDQIVFETDKKNYSRHEAGLLTVDIGKAKKELNWHPTWDSSKAIEKTVKWYKDFMTQNKVNTDKDIREYVTEAIHMQQIWAQQ